MPRYFGRESRPYFDDPDDFVCAMFFNFESHDAAKKFSHKHEYPVLILFKSKLRDLAFIKNESDKGGEYPLGLVREAIPID